MSHLYFSGSARKGVSRADGGVFGFCIIVVVVVVVIVVVIVIIVVIVVVAVACPSQDS